MCFICHGSSEARTITSAIRNAIQYARHEVNDAIVKALGVTEAPKEVAS